MTAVLDRPGIGDVWAIGTPRLLSCLDATHAQHTATHGALPALSLDRLLHLLDDTRLGGRGGAGFPLATKLRGLASGRRRVIVNGTESEPASHKDRILLRRAPHLVLDGALLVAAAIDARTVTVAVHDTLSADAVRRAAAERGAPVEVAVTAGGFVAGEARAVVRALKGGPALPPGRRDLPTDAGLLVSNAETFAQVAVLARLGSHAFAATGTLEEPGTTLLTVGGAVARPGVAEVPIGTPLSIVLAAAQAAASESVVIGGYHGGWVAPVPDLRLSRGGLAAVGGAFGAGVVQVLDRRTCALGELAHVAQWLAAQSARQCGPCTFGLPALAGDVAALWRGDARAVNSAFAHGRAISGRGACGHPDGSVRFVMSGLDHLHDEVELHLAGGCGRPVLGQLVTR